MRFPRNTKIFRGQLDAAPYAGVLFLLVIFLVLSSNFVFIPGLPIHLPAAAELPGTTRPTVAVVVDQAGQFYFDNQVTDEAQLEKRLREAVDHTREPLTLVVQADEEVRYRVLARLWRVARSAGIQDLIQATRPVVVPGVTTAAP
jgi:biopolymer transport protein ExbD